MKKLINFILVFSFVFLLTIISVSAETIESSNVSNSTYIIGTHMFTRSTSEGYNGVLTTEHIMLAAKTIEGNSLNDMVIYYKNARGKWTNALTQREVSQKLKISRSYVSRLEKKSLETLQSVIKKEDYR